MLRAFGATERTCGFGPARAINAAWRSPRQMQRLQCRPYVASSGDDENRPLLPLRTMRTRSAALRAPILSMMRGRWTSTVRGLMPSRRPASLLEAPPAISASTSHSRGVRLRPGKSTNAPFLLLAFSNRSEKASMAPLTRDKENDDSIAGQRENDRECIVHHRIVITMRRLRVPGVSEAITASLQISVRSILQRQRHEVK
jgi:hypothetical protein